MCIRDSYNGWQKQGNTDNTIQGKLETLLSRIAGEPVEIHGAGRTDAGVHAAGQVANAKFHTDVYKRQTLRIELISCVSGRLAGQIKEQQPHSQHSIPPYFRNFSSSPCSAKTERRAGRI